MCSDHGESERRPLARVDRDFEKGRVDIPKTPGQTIDLSQTALTWTMQPGQLNATCEFNKAVGGLLSR